MNQMKSQTNTQIIAQWEWKSNPHPFLTSEESQWTAFQPSENDLLEIAFKKNEKEVDLGDYVVFLEEGLQKKKGDPFKQRQVRRNAEILKNKLDQEENIRAQRFFGAETPRTFNKVFGNLSDYLKFFKNRSSELKEFTNLFNDIEESGNLDQLNNIIIPSLLDCFENEAKKVPKESKSLARLVALFKDPFKSFEEFYQKVIRAYTLETFLYRNANLYLRNEDWAQLDTTLPYIYCLCKAFFRSEFLKKVEKKTLYRGAAFDEIALSFYDQNITRNFCWNSMTSTSTNRQIAEKFMYLNVEANKVMVIFIIEVQQNSQDLENPHWIDVKPFSAVPQEDEIVLAPGSMFEITGVSRSRQDVVEISLKLIDSVDNLIQGGQIVHGTMHSEMAQDRQLKMVCLEERELSEAIIHLRGNKLVEELEFCLCKFNEKALVTLSETLKIIPNLKKLVFSSPLSVDQAHFSTILSQLRDIQLKTLEIYGKDAILDQSQLNNIANGIGCLTSLQSLTLDFSYCIQITDSGLRRFCMQGIQHLKSLTTLILHFNGCLIVDEGLDELSQGIQHLTSLTTLILHFNAVACFRNTGLHNLCSKGIKQLTLLNSLDLNFGSCNGMTDEGLSILSSQAIKYLPSLRVLNLDFSVNLTIGDQALINFCHQGIPHLNLLTSLTLNFCECAGITDKGLRILGSEGIKCLSSLTFLSLNFAWCRSITEEGLSDLCSQGIKPLILLKSLAMKFDGCMQIYSKGKQMLQELLSHFQPILFEDDSDTKLLTFERGLPNKIVEDLARVVVITKKDLQYFTYNLSTRYTNMKIHLDLFSTMEELDSAITIQWDHLTSLKSLVLKFKNFEQNITGEFNDLWSEKIKHLNSLTSLTLDFSGCSQITDEILEYVDFKEIPNLKSLSLDFTGCLNITDQGFNILWRQGISHLTSLLSLTIDFRCCQITDEGLSDLSCQAIRPLTSLKCLTLQFCDCINISDRGLKDLCAQGIRHLASLSSLSLDFTWCGQITDKGLSNLWWKGIQDCASLTSLSLNFNYCKISNQGLKCLDCKEMKNLTTLFLSFRGCLHITDEGLKFLSSRGIRHLISLKSLTLDFVSCHEITDQGLSTLCSEGFKYLTSLASLALNFHWCWQITTQGVNSLCFQGLKYLNSLTSLILDFRRDYEITDEALENLCWQGIKHLPSLRYFYLHLEGCKKVTDPAWKNFIKVLRYFGLQLSKFEREDLFYKTEIDDPFLKVDIVDPFSIFLSKFTDLIV